jgi:hypothetical protein
MSVKSQTRHEGWLLIDHSCSPGIPREIALRIGLNPAEVAEGKKMERATVPCKHCGGHVVKNPKRKRPRQFCRLCDHYICDGCAYLAAQPGYVHRCKEAIFDAAASRSLIIL